MAVKSQQLLDYAKSVIEQESEAACRCAASRSYYAMYHAVTEIITQPIPNYGGGGVHFKLIEHLQDRNNGEPYEHSKQRSLAYMLRMGRDNRVRADYKIDDEFDKTDAQSTISTAERVLSVCYELKSVA